MRYAFAILLLLAILVVSCQLSPRDLVGSAAGAETRPDPRFRTIGDIPLPGDTSRFDYESYDPQAHRLYLAHLGAGVVLVVDTQTRAVVGTVPNVPGVHGVLAVPPLGRVYATATDANQVAVIDATTVAVIASVPGGDYPDGLAYDPEVEKVYVSDERGEADTVIDARTNQRVATIPLGGEVGNTQYDPATHRVYAAVQTRNQIVAIDPRDRPGCRALRHTWL
jgi:YVTN family beta-propeller protein